MDEKSKIHAKPKSIRGKQANFEKRESEPRREIQQSPKSRKQNWKSITEAANKRITLSTSDLRKLRGF